MCLASSASSSCERIPVSSSSRMLSPVLSCGRYLNSFWTSSAVKESFLLNNAILALSDKN